jgi:hypothetical protein
MLSAHLSERAIFFLALATGCLFPTACSKGPPAPPASPISEPEQQAASTSPSPKAGDADLSSLFSHIWRVTKVPSQSPPGSIFIFLANGTLLETSCTETYRIATWTIDKALPRELRVVEDKQLAFTANIAELTNSTLILQKRLVQSKEMRDVTFTAVEGEYVCPDLRNKSQASPI